jgi:hypothetical protein
VNSEKLVLKILTKNKETFRNIFDEKLQKMSYDISFFKDHMKNILSPTGKVKVAILKSVSLWFETNNKNEMKNKEIFL